MMETNNTKRISLPTGVPTGAIIKDKTTPKNERLSFSIADGESELFVGNGPPHSINQSEYSIIKSLVDKISTAKGLNDDQHSFSVNMEQSNLALRETVQKLQQELLDA